MSDKKNIDRLFQERFKDFESTPSDAVWNSIEAQLKQKKKKQRVIPIWWRYAGVAALLLLLLTIGNSFLGDSTDVIPSNQVVETEDTTINNSSEKLAVENPTVTKIPDVDAIENNALENNPDGVLNTENISDKLTPSKESAVAETNSEKNKVENEFKTNSTLKNNSKSIIKSEKHDVVAKNSEEKITNPVQNKESEISNNAKAILNNKTADKLVIAKISENEKNNRAPENEPSIDATKSDNIIKNIKENNTTVAIIKDSENEAEKKIVSIEDFLNETNDITNEEQLNRWSVTPNAAPVYFNTLGEGSSIDGQFNKNAKTAETNLSYGISASYAVNNKISIRSGINKVNLGYSTNNVVAFEALVKTSSLNVLSNVSAINKTKSGISNISYYVTVVSAENFESYKGESLVSNSNTSLNQSLSYIEVPLEIQYMLSDKKLGVNLIGGFSSFFLSDNELFSEIQGQRTSVGEATNINKVSYSANLGLGFQYKFTKKLNLNLEPMFKYQINTFNNTSGNFTPYFIGVYTGIGFKF